MKTVYVIYNLKSKQYFAEYKPLGYWLGIFIFKKKISKAQQHDTEEEAIDVLKKIQAVSYSPEHKFLSVEKIYVM